MHVCSNQHWKIVLVLSFFVHCWKIVEKVTTWACIIFACLWSSDFVAFFLWLQLDCKWSWVEIWNVSTMSINFLKYMYDSLRVWHFLLLKYSTKVVKRLTIINKHNPLAWFDVISLKTNTFYFSVGMVPCLLQSLCWS